MWCTVLCHQRPVRKGPLCLHPEELSPVYVKFHFSVAYTGRFSSNGNRAQLVWTRTDKVWLVRHCPSPWGYDKVTTQWQGFPHCPSPWGYDEVTTQRKGFHFARREGESNPRSPFLEKAAILWWIGTTELRHAPTPLHRYGVHVPKSMIYSKSGLTTLTWFELWNYANGNEWTLIFSKHDLVKVIHKEVNERKAGFWR